MLSLSLDEVISYTREVAEKKRRAINFNSKDSVDDDIKMNCLNCAEGHEQLTKWLEELKEYHKIGTLEECRAAVELIKPKSRIIREGKYYCCNCGRFAKTSGHCSYCGQNLY